MPNGDGTGPLGTGRKFGRKMGYCSGQGKPGNRNRGLWERMFGAFGGGNGKGKKQTGLAATPMAGRPQKPGFSREEEA